MEGEDMGGLTRRHFLKHVVVGGLAVAGIAGAVLTSYYLHSQPRQESIAEEDVQKPTYAESLPKIERYIQEGYTLVQKGQQGTTRFIGPIMQGRDSYYKAIDLIIRTHDGKVAPNSEMGTVLGELFFEAGEAHELLGEYELAKKAYGTSIHYSPKKLFKVFSKDEELTRRLNQK